MISTLLVRDVLYTAGSLLQDVSPQQFVHFKERQLVDFANDAQAALAKFLPASCARLDAIKLVPGTRQSIENIPAANCKPGDGSTPTVPILGNLLLGIACNMGADGLTRGRVVRMVARKDLDARDPDWHLASKAGTSVRHYAFDPATPRYFYVDPPVPASPAVWLEASFTAQPIKIPNTGSEGAEIYKWDGSNATTLSVADEFKDDVVNYVVARANLMDVEWADANKATVFANLFLGSLNAKVAALTGNNPNLKQLPFAPQPIGAAK